MTALLKTPPTPMQPSSAFDFAAILNAGDVVAWPQGTGEPLGLTRRLVAERHGLPPIRLFIGITTGDSLSPACADRFQMTALNGSGSNRRLTAKNVLDVIPTHVSTVSGLVRRGLIPVDITLLRVRPTETPGVYSLGVVCDYTEALIKAARCVVAEVDERLPLTRQDALVGREDLDVLVAADNDEILMRDAVPTPVETAIGRNIASVIPDRATVQLGIGGLSVAVSHALMDHRDLGVHTGVVSDAFVPMVEKGVVTNAYKGIDAGVSVTGCLFGSEILNRFASHNPALSMRCADHTHTLRTMAQIKAFHSINFAIEVDVTGQVNAELAAGRYLGAVGGQADFVRGSQVSEGGRSIIAVPSTTPDGKISRIVASLAGHPVTTVRADVDMVITEHGVADLRGASFGERLKRLVAIAHPDFREDLLRSGAAVFSRSPSV